ncbi:MAG TPA: hypothetical protein VFZ13_09245 [Gemmatimonadales bacterium]
MRTVSILSAALIAAFPLAAQAPAKEKPAPAAAHANHDPDHAAHGGALPAGWSARVDRGDAANIKLAPMGGGLHVTMGPAAILWRDADRVNGPFHTVASFARTKAPAHAEAYGLFYGGTALNGEGQKYTYFLVRGDGSFLVRERNGAETRNVSSGWTENAAVNRADASGKVTDKLEIDASKAGTVRFLANGKVVHEMAADANAINGIVGLRVNHNLDIHVDGFEVHKVAEGQPAGAATRQ